MKKLIHTTIVGVAIMLTPVITDHAMQIERVRPIIGWLGSNAEGVQYQIEFFVRIALLAWGILYIAKYTRPEN